MWVADEIVDDRELNLFGGHGGRPRADGMRGGKGMRRMGLLRA